MIFIIIIFFILIAAIGKMCEKTWVNPLTLFAIIFTTVVYAASLGFYNMRNVSSRAYLIIFIGVIAFAIGYLVYYAHPVRIRINNKKKISNYNYNETIFRIFIIISVIAWSAIFVLTLIELSSGIPYRQIRDNFGGVSDQNALFQNSLINFLVKWLLVPMVEVIVAKTIYSIFSSHFSKMFYILVSIVFVEYVVSTGSRVIILYTVVQILFLYFLKTKHNNFAINLKKKTKRAVRIIVFVSFIGIYLITSFRPAKASNNVQSSTLYVYTSVPVPLLDYWINYVDSIKYRTYGIAFLFGILQWIARLGIPMPSFYYKSAELISYCSDTYIPIFGLTVYNAFDTVFFYFYMDFGYFGVVLGAFVFGMLTSSLYRQFRNSTDEFTSVRFLIYLIAVSTSFARWQFTTAPYIMMFILTRLMYSKNSRKGATKN